MSEYMDLQSKIEFFDFFIAESAEAGFFVVFLIFPVFCDRCKGMREERKSGDILSGPYRK